MEGLHKIESKSLEEHKNELEKQFDIFQLSYVDALIQNKILPFEENFTNIKFNENGEEVKQEIVVDTKDFNLLLTRYTRIIEKFVITHRKIENPNFDTSAFSTEEYENISNIYIHKIKDFYIQDQKNWIKNTLSLLDEMNKKVIEVNKTEDFNSNNIDEKKNKIIFENIINGDLLKSFFKNTNYEFNEHDNFLEIHLLPFIDLYYNTPEKNIFSDDALKELAINIVDNYPEAKGVIGRSWVLDTPIAERIGFKILKKEITPDGAFWGQFQDAKGQLVKSRVNKLLETGVPPYQVATGVIDTVDFLKKYLPKERKGQIILKELNPEISEELNNTYKHVELIFSEFDKYNVSDFEKAFNQNKYLVAFNQSKEGEGLLLYLLDKLKKNIPLDSFFESAEFKSFSFGFRKYINDIKYISKKVIVD